MNEEIIGNYYIINVFVLFFLNNKRKFETKHEQSLNNLQVKSLQSSMHLSPFSRQGHVGFLHDLEHKHERSCKMASRATATSSQSIERILFSPFLAQNNLYLNSLIHPCIVNMTHKLFKLIDFKAFNFPRPAKALTVSLPVIAVFRSKDICHFAYEQTKQNLIASDLPKLMSLVSNINKQIATIIKEIEILSDRIEDSPGTSQGISFLEVKYHLLLEYVMNLSHLVMMKLEGQNIANSPTVERLVEIKVVLEKMRPIDHKLKYQIDKLLKIVASGTIDINDPLQFKANPDGLMNKLEGDLSSSEDEKGNRKYRLDSQKAYMPPKLAAMHYVMELFIGRNTYLSMGDVMNYNDNFQKINKLFETFIDGDENENKQKKHLENARKKVLSSSIMEDLRREYDEGPEEITEVVNVQKESLKKNQKHKIHYEEDNFVRLSVSKKDRNAAKKVDTLSSLKNITRFEDLSVLDHDAVAMVLGVIAEHSLPLSMAPVLIGLSKKLAKDSKALTKLSLDRTTAAYKLRFGLADTMLARTIENIKQVPFSLNMDESTSKTLLRVFTILVSYYSDSSHEVVVEHLASVSLIKVASAPLFEQITGLFDKYNLPWENLMSVLMDSCNVMRGSKTGLEVRLREKASHLLDIDGDSCHHIHNCSKKFCEPFEKAVEKLHTDIYNDFKWSADLMDALKEICMILEVKFTKPDRFLGHRWLSCYDVTLANLRLMDAYLMFYYSFIPKESKPLYHHVVVSIFHSKEASNQSRMRIRVIQEELSRKSLTEDGRKRKNRIVEKLFYKRKQIITILHFYSAVLAMLKQYVCLFELKKPMIHKLYDRQAELFQEFLGLFIKPEELEHKTLKQLKEMDIDKADLLSKKSMFIGFSTEKALQQLDEISAGQFLTKAQTAFKACAGYMQKKLPLTNATLRRLSAIDPTAVGHSLTLLHLKKLPKTFPTVLNMSERQSYDREVHAFQLDCNLPPAHHLDETPVQLDHWWRDVIKMGKYPALTKMAKAIMSCFHGPLVESSFNLMQDILDTRSGRMKIETFNAFQTVKYSITAQKKSSLELFDRQDILRDPVNTTLCNNLQESWKRYKEEKENKRKVIEQKKAAYALKAAKLESKQKSKVAQQLVEKKARMAFIQKRQNNLKRKANLEALVANKKTKRTL
ncbi:Neuroguidin [Nymphon striatum]|nr:Neuroguidin [Nymphon striatum]